MKPTLRPGASRTNRYTVDDARATGIIGQANRVYATPMFVRDIERTCRDLLVEHCETGEDSVGMEVVLRHIAPTLIGMSVDIIATITAVDGRKVSFDVFARDEIEPIGTGSHKRFVVDLSKSGERLKAKAEKFAALHGSKQKCG
jgi:fluoroacetyl-CoA thioesterase